MGRHFFQFGLRKNNSEKNPKATANFKFGTGFLSVFFGLQPPKIIMFNDLNETT